SALGAERLTRPWRFRAHGVAIIGALTIARKCRRSNGLAAFAGPKRRSACRLFPSFGPPVGRRIGPGEPHPRVCSFIPQPGATFARFAVDSRRLASTGGLERMFLDGSFRRIILKFNNLEGEFHALQELAGSRAMSAKWAAPE